MSSSETPSSAILFKSKKTLSSSNPLLQDQESLSSKTPEKPAQLPYRDRNLKAGPTAASSLEFNRQLPDDKVDGNNSIERQNESPSRSEGVIDKRKKLPEKFEILSKFFNSLDSAIRLLRLKGLASYFSNICPKIEYLTDRKFSYGHLAQLKFILPEAIEIKKVVVFDERTSSMKPDLHISFNYSILDCQGNLETGSWSMHLKKMFRTRLSEFVSSDSEIDEVPKELLPEPFNPSSQPAISSTNVTDEVPFNGVEEGLDLPVNAAPISMSPTRTVNGQCEEEKFVGVSHLPHSFSRHFSKKSICREAERTELAMNPHTQDSSHSTAGARTKVVDADAESLSKASSPVKLPSNPTFASPHCSSALSLPETPGKFIADEEDLAAKANDIDSTPAKLVSTPAKLMINTPAMPPPQKSFMSPDDDSIFSQNKLLRHPSRSRSLIFDDDEPDGSGAASLDDI